MAALRIIMIAIVLLALAALVFLQWGDFSGVGDGAAEVVIAGETFSLEVAADAESREKGLMGRTTIPADGGMLFIFPEAQRQSFWMGHCVIDIDLLFLNEAGRIVAVHEMKAEAPQRRDETEAEYRERMPGYPSGLPALFAIELKAGSIDRLGIEPGDRVEMDFRGLKRLAR